LKALPAAATVSRNPVKNHPIRATPQKQVFSQQKILGVGSLPYVYSVIKNKELIFSFSYSVLVKESCS
jgi:hypothetical protein